jgi:hypothetical protein
MQRVRARIGDIKVTRLLGQFLKAWRTASSFRQAMARRKVV